MTGIISDIHGNLEALTAVFADGERRGVTRWVCLGDIVGYGADPSACLEWVKSRCEIIILGNHDEMAAQELSPDDFNPLAQQAILWTRAMLSAEQRSWLKQLPLSVHEGDRLYVHASPVNPANWQYIYSPSEARRQMAGLDHSIQNCFIGHTHEPFDCLCEDGRRLCNVGSVGQPRDSKPDSSYIIINDDSTEVQFIRTPYDVQTAHDKILAAHLPEMLANRLLTGH